MNDFDITATKNGHKIKFVLHVVEEEDLQQKKRISQCVSAILANIPNTNITELTLTHLEGNRVFYSVNQREPAQLDLVPHERWKIDIQEISKEKSATSLFTSMIWRDTTKVSSKESAKIARSLLTMDRLGDLSNWHALLNNQLDILKKRERVARVPSSLKNLLITIQENNHKIFESLQSGDQISHISRNLAQKLLDFSVSRSNQRKELLLSFCGGYWVGQNFVPGIYSFYKEGEHIFYRQSFLSKDPENTLNELVYRFSLPKNNEELTSFIEQTCIPLIQHIITLSISPQSQKLLISTDEKGVLKKLRFATVAKTKKTPSSIKEMSAYRFLQEAAQSLGFEQLAASKIPISNGIKLIDMTLDFLLGIERDAFGKVLDSIADLNQLMQVFIDSYSMLSLEEKDQMANKIEFYLNTLRFQWLKLTPVQKKNIERMAAHKTLQNRWEETSQLINKIKQSDVQHIEDILGSLKVTGMTTIEATVALRAPVTRKEHVTSEQVLGIVTLYKKELENLRSAIEKSNHADAIRIFKKLSEVVDQQVEQRKYEQAMTLADRIFSLLPPPSIDKSGFWGTLDSKDSIDTWGNLLTNLTQFHWESFLHLHLTNMQPAQLLNSINTRAILVKLARQKSYLIKNKIKETTQFDDNTLNQFSRDPRILDKIFLEKHKISLEDATSLMFDQYQTDSRQILDLIHFHPYFRFAYNPQVEKKLLEIEIFLDSVSQLGGKVVDNALMLRLDAIVDASQSKEFKLDRYTANSDSSFIQAIKSLLRANNITEHSIQLWSSISPQHPYFPNEILNLRKHTAMMQMQLHPEFSLALSFTPSAIGQQEALTWYNNLFEQSIEEVGPEGVWDALQQKAYIQLNKKIDQMGRLKLTTDVNYIFRETPLISLVDTNYPNMRLSYLPWGLGFPKELAEKFNPMPDDHNAKSIAGSPNKEWVDACVTVSDNLHVNPLPLDQNYKKAQTFQDKISLTESGELVRCLQEAEGDVIDEWFLKTLEIGQATVAFSRNRTGYTLTLQSLKEAMNLIRKRPDLLENVQVRRRLELIFTRPYFIQRMLRYDPEGVATFAVHLKNIIEDKLTRKKESVGFLLRLGDLFFAHTSQAIKSLEENKQNDLYLRKFKSDFNRVSRDKDLAHLIDQIKITLSKIPHSETDYQLLPGQTKTGSNILYSWSINPKLNTLLASLRLAQKEMELNPVVKAKQLNLENLQQKIILAHLRPTLSILKEEVEMPMENVEVLNWLDEEFFPALFKKIQKDINYKKTFFQDYLNKAKATQKATAKGIDLQHELGSKSWESDSENPHQFRCGTVTVDMLSGKISCRGKILALATAESAIPVEICKANPLYNKFFGSEEILAFVRPGSHPNEYLYEFSKENLRFRIQYDAKEKTVEILQKFPARISGLPKASWYRYQEIHTTADAGIASLVSRYGVWINEKDPSQAIIILSTSLSPPDDSIFRSKINSKGIISNLIALNGHIVIPKHEEMASIPFKCTNISNIILLRDSYYYKLMEIRFIDIGLTLIRSEKREWECTGIYKGYKLLTEKGKSNLNPESLKRTEALLNSLWPEYLSCSIPLAKKSHCALLVFPHKIQQQQLFPTVIFEQQAFLDEPLVPFLVEISEQGTITASPGAYLYFAYLFAEKKNYKYAIEFLKFAEQSRVGSSEERKAFEVISNYFKERIPKPRSRRDLAFQIKAEVLLLKINRQQLGIYFYDPIKWGPYFNRVQRVCEYFDSFETKSRQSNWLKSIYAEGLIPNEQELNELQQFRLEGMRYFIDAYRQAPLVESIEPFVPELTVFKVLTIDDISEEFLFHIIAMAEDPIAKKISKKDLLNPSKLKALDLIHYFIWYYEQIVNDDLTLKDIDFLFRPFSEASMPNLSATDKLLISYADLSRKILIQLTLAKARQQCWIDFIPENVKPLQQDSEELHIPELDLKTILERKRNLPELKTGSYLGAYFDLAASATNIAYKKLIDRKDFARAIKEVLLGPTLFGKELFLLVKTPLLFHVDSTAKMLQFDNINYIQMRGGLEELPATKEKKVTTPTTINQSAVIEGYKRALEDKNLSPAERMAYETIISEMGDVEGEENTFALEEFLEIANARGVSLVDLRREHEIARGIHRLERKIKTDAKKSLDYEDFDAHALKLHSIDFQFIPHETIFEGFLDDSESLDVDQVRDLATLDTVSSDLKKIFANGVSEQEKEEFEQIQKGAITAKEVIASRLEKGFTLLSSSLDSSLHHLSLQLQPSKTGSPRTIYDHEKHYREGLLAWINKHAFKDPAIIKMKNEPGLYSDQDLIDAVLDLYQKKHLRGSPQSKKINEHEQLISTYLIYATAKQQLEKSYELASSRLVSIRDAMKNDPDNKNLEIDWSETVNLITNLINNGLNFTRYCDSSGKLLNPEFSRKYLVCEYRNQVILRKEQIELIESLSDNPKQWKCLRMGLGKTSYIMPIVASLLAEQGLLPVLVVPTQLRDMNLSEFDKKTRLLYGKVAEPFTATMHETTTPGYLAEKYQHLLQVFNEKGYIVTTVETLATIKNLTIELAEKKIVLFEKFQSLTEAQEEERQKTLQEFYFIERKLYWLMKTETLLNGTKETTGIDTIFFGDEVDSLFDIRKEINRALGNKIPVNPQIRNLVRFLFEKLLAKKHATHDLNTLKEHILNGTQASMSIEELKNSLKLFAAELYQDSVFRNLTNNADGSNPLDNISQEQLVDYLVGDSDQEIFEKWDDKALKGSDTYLQQRNFAILKRLFSTTFPSILSIEPGIGFGFREEDGMMIVPKQQQQETPGNRFGDEYELIAFQYLGFLQATSCQNLSGTSTEFFKRSIGTLEETHPDIYAQLKAKADSAHKDIYIYLMRPESAMERVALLELLVLGTGYVNRFFEQITLSCQEVLSGRSCGGVTGTLNPYALPQYQASSDPNAPSTRTVEAETFLQIGLKLEKGLDQPVVHFKEADALASMIAVIQESGTVAIINEGGYGMQGRSTIDWVSILKKDTDKSFLFIHPVERVPYLWMSDEHQPERFKGILPKDTVCLYGPPDTRGTDLPIPPGNVHYYPLRTTNLQDMGQSVWRARGLGTRHAPVFHLPDTWNVDTVGQALLSIARKGVENQSPSNLKAELFRIQDMIKNGIRIALFSVSSELEHPDYWDFSISRDILYSNVLVDQSLFKHFRDLFIQKKEVDFNQDYSPLKRIETIEKILQTFKMQIKFVKDEQKILVKDISLLLQKFPSLKHLTGKQIEDLLLLAYRYAQNDLDEAGKKQFASLLPIPIDLLDECLKNRQKVFSIPREIQGPMQAFLRFNDIYKALNDIVATLKKENEELIENHGIHRKFLPDETALQTAGVGGSQEQVQQQQQQQQTAVKEPMKKRAAFVKTLNNTFASWNMDDLEDPVKAKMVDINTILPDCNLENIFLTPELFKIFNILPIKNGQPIANVCINDNEQLILISKLDYNRIISRICKIRRSPQEKRKVGVYLLIDPDKALVDQGAMSHDLKQINLLRRFVQIKILLGYSQFTEDEENALVSWIESLSNDQYNRLKRWIDENGDPPRQLPLLEKLKNR